VLPRYINSLFANAGEKYTYIRNKVEFDNYFDNYFIENVDYFILYFYCSKARNNL